MTLISYVVTLQYNGKINVLECKAESNALLLQGLTQYYPKHKIITFLKLSYNKFEL